MAYEAKTNWKLDDTVMPDDMNRIEQGIADMDIDIENVSKTVSVIEPSDTNIVDLNSFTNTGIYIIKNATNSNTLNTPFNYTTQSDYYLVVHKNELEIRQTYSYVLNSRLQSYARQYSQAETSWSAWSLQFFRATLAIPTTGWSSSAPYTINISISGILQADYNVVAIPQWDSDLTTRQAQQEAWGLVSMITTNDGSVTITCDEEIPQTAVPLMLIVNR